MSTEADLLSNPALVYIKGDQAGFEIYDHAGRPAGSYRNAELRDSDGGRWLSLRLRSLSKPPFTIIDSQGFEIARVSRMRMQWRYTVRAVEGADGSRGSLRLSWTSDRAGVFDPTGAPVAHMIRGNDAFMVEIAPHTEPAIRAVALLAPMIWSNRIEFYESQIGGG